MDLERARTAIGTFVDSGVDRPTLGLVYGRRRIGKSTLLTAVSAERNGFYWEATRGETALHLARLGEALGNHLGVGRLTFGTWEEALGQVLRLGENGPLPIVLDEFGYLLDADPTLDSVVASLLGPGARNTVRGRGRLVLCGSAIALMRALTAGEAALRGRAGMEILMQPLDDRAAARLLPVEDDPALATRVYAVIGGVIGYYTDMVDFDLPVGLADFDRWIAARVLSPAATLHHEATTLLAEDPTLSSTNPTVYHTILSAIATGSVTAGAIANRLRRSVSSLDPAIKRLTAAGFVHRLEDPIRSQRPSYRLADPFLLFHYAILEPHGPLLRERDTLSIWRDRLATVFDAQVRGPVFEEQTRSWARRHADLTSIGGPAAPVIGPSAVTVDGVDHQLDLVVADAADPALPPAERPIHAIGEAKAGRTVGAHELRALERARAALGTRAAHARLVFFATAFADDLRELSRSRSDLELVDLERLYGGS